MTAGQSAQGALNSAYDDDNDALIAKRIGGAGAWSFGIRREWEGLLADVVDSDGTVRIVEVA